MAGTQPKLTWKYYQLHSGTLPVKDFIEGLPKLAMRTRLVTRMERIPQLGMIEALRLKWVKKIDDDLYELRASIQSEQLRILFTWDSNLLVALSGFDKKSEKLPSNEKTTAQSRLADYKAHRKYAPLP